MIELTIFDNEVTDLSLFRKKHSKSKGQKVRCSTPEEFQQFQQFNAVNDTRLVLQGVAYVRLSSDNIKLLDEGVKMIEHEGKFYLPENTNTNGRSLQLSA